MLREIVSQIYAKNAMQRKRLEPYLATRDESFWLRGDALTTGLTRYLASRGFDAGYAADAYLRMCREILVEQTKFQRSGCYSCRDQGAAYVDVYSNTDAMLDYMVGLAVSQFLWKNHYEIYAWYLEVISRLRGRVANYLEIGPGHGAYLAAAISGLDAGDYRAIDISDTSLDVCRGVLPFLCERIDRVRLERRDALEMPTDEPIDLLTMGEVIEHLDDPRPVLRKIASLLSDAGRAFLTTCANCPTKDHVYQFHDADEIRALLNECGLEIESELELPGDAMPAPGARCGRLVNYAAVVRRAPR